MNLHALASPVIATVNPMTTVSIQISTGYTTAADATRTPTYKPPITRTAQVQPLTYRDLAQLDGLNLQGEKRAFYLFGDIEGISRPDRQGGDLITMPDKTVWLVALVLETYPGWCKVAAVRQNQGGC